MAAPTLSAPELALDRIKAALGPRGWSDDPERVAPKLTEWRGRWRGETPLLVLPRTTSEVAAVVGLCSEAGVAITPQGGNTGLVGGQIPRGEVLLSLERMRSVREVSAVDDVLVAEAGCTLAAVHAAALTHTRRFPLNLASEGTATVGGLVSTNAGGTAVLRYGSMRSLVLGLEAVLPNGEVWNGLKRLRKDNTGYDLKHLLIGAEGTLGVVTAAALKLSPVLQSRAVAICGLTSPRAALDLLGVAKRLSGDALEAFELMSRSGLALVLENIGGREPLAAVYPWCVLIETATADPGGAEAALERVLAAGLEGDLVMDAVQAQSEAQAAAFWALRENQSAGQKPEGAAWKHDVSVPVSRVADFILKATTAVERFCPGVRVVAFGHVGDGNIHFDVIRPEGGDDDDHDARRDEGARIVHDLVHAMEGSISAEHGLGSMKTAEGARYKSETELAAQRAVRAALDPGRIMNPRVLF